MTAPLRRIRPVAAALAALLLGGAALLATASPAAAHDELLSTDPAAGTEVAVLPDTLTLTFSGELLGDGGANEVQVTDAAGQMLGDGPAVVDGTTLTQALAGEASGSIQVLWRVVSSDGHPISGEFSFTVAETTAPTPAAGDETTPAPSASAPPLASAEPAPTATPDDQAGAADPLPWILGAVILLAVIALVLYLLVVRPRRGGADPGTGADR